MTVVSPERDPLAGALTFGAPRPEDTRASSLPRRASVRAPRIPIHVTTSAHAPLHVADWSLSLGSDEAGVAPDVAFSAALSMSAGPPPLLAHGAVVVPISAISVEEGAWEQRRR